MADDPLATFDGPLKFTRRSQSKEETEPFAIVTRQVILSARDMTCLAIYLYLDFCQGAYGPPPHGLFR